MLGLALDPLRASTLYAATQSGLFKSSDGANSWRAVAPELAGLRANAVAVDPVSEGTVYMATALGVYKSYDGGAHFDPPTASFYASGPLTIAPSDPTRIYTLSRTLTWSTDAGATWEQSEAALVLASIAVDAVDADTVYGMTDGGELWKTRDHGLTFSLLRTWSPAPPSAGAIVTDPARPAIVQVAITGQGVFRSTDGGASWQTSRADASNWFTSFAYDPAAPDHVYLGYYSFDMIPTGSDLVPARAGLLESRDGGASWAEGPAVGVNSQLVLAPGGQRAYLVGPRGLFRSPDGLRSQQRAMSGMHDIEIFAIAADARWPGLLYAATPVGLYLSRTDALVWRHDTSIPVRRVTGLVTAPNRAGVAYLGSDSGSTYVPSEEDPHVFHVLPNAGKLFATFDGGGRWRELGPLPDAYAELRPLAVSPADFRTLYVAASSRIIPGGTSGESALLATQDAGQTWRALNGPQGCCAALVAASASHLYASSFGNLLYESSDGGASWAQLVLDLPVQSLVMDPRDRQTLYVGSAARLQPSAPVGFRRSTDGGRTWSVPSALFEDRGVSVRSASPVDGRLYVSVSAPEGVSEVYVSTDRGVTFALANAGLGMNHVGTIAPHPSLRCRAFAGTGQGVYATNSGGGACR